MPKQTASKHRNAFRFVQKIQKLVVVSHSTNVTSK